MNMSKLDSDRQRTDIVDIQLENTNVFIVDVQKKSMEDLIKTNFKQGDDNVNGRYFKLIIEKVGTFENVAEFYFKTSLEIKIAYELLFDSNHNPQLHFRTLAMDDSGCWNGYEIN